MNPYNQMCFLRFLLVLKLLLGSYCNKLLQHDVHYNRATPVSNDIHLSVLEASMKLSQTTTKTRHPPGCCEASCPNHYHLLLQPAYLRPNWTPSWTMLAKGRVFAVVE
jgi:hypothetical protein